MTTPSTPQTTNNPVEHIIDELVNFTLSLAEESERIAVIMGVAQVDITLEKLLKALLQPNPGGSDNLFDPEQSLSTFAVKISAALRFGVIDVDFEHALQMLRRIRNDFAHSTQPVHLTDSAQRSRLKEIIPIVQLNSHYQKFLATIHRTVNPIELAQFCSIIALILIKLENATMLNSRYKPNYVAKFSQ